MGTPTFESIPRDGALAQDPIPLGNVGKGGKPLSDKPEAVKARAWRARRAASGRPVRPQRRKASTRARGARSLAPEIGAFLALVNGAVIASPLGTRPVEAITDPTIPAERVGDELDAIEIGALASSIDAQCRRSPRFRKYVESVLSAGSGGTLLTVVALIAARRMARHGVLPENVDVMGGIILAADVGALANLTPPPSSEPDPDTGEVAPDRTAGDDDASEQ